MSTTRDQILAAAMDLFSRQGYEGVSVREIARAVGIKESSLYNHFRNKEAILETIFAAFRQELTKLRPPRAELDRILPALSVAEFLNRGFAWFKAHLDQPAAAQMWRIATCEQYRHPMAREILLHDVIGENLAFFELVFGKWIELGRIRPRDPRLLAAEYQYTVFGLANHYNMLRFDQQETGEVERRMADHIAYFVASLQPADSAAVEERRRE